MRGRGRLAATPKGMWWASLREIRSQPAGVEDLRAGVAGGVVGGVVEAQHGARRVARCLAEVDVGGGDPVRDAEQRVQAQRLVHDVAQVAVVVRVGGQPLLTSWCSASTSSRCAIASDICTTAVLKKVPCR